MIVVTHEMSFAQDVASQVIFLDDGLIVESGSPKEIFSHPKNERTKQFLLRIIPQDYVYSI
jgi:L-cystine transport system ATP-binding protein